MPQDGFLFISDITGYSAYISKSELEHARDSLSVLLNLLIEHTQSPLVIAKLEGDAVFSYAPAGSFLQGQTLLEMVETIYLAFRKALDLMVINTTCSCAACSNLPNLDLKFFIHYGSFSTQALGDFRELVGNDVNLVHRLAKNQVYQQTGLKAYAAYTRAVMDILQMDVLMATMIPHRESYPDVGEVQLYVQDMHGVWERRRGELRLVVKPEDALAVLEFDFPIPQTLLWDYLTRPEYRTILLGADSQQLKNLAAGRTGLKSAYYCAHGSNISVHTIVDWQPFDQYTTHETHPVPGITAYYTYRFVPDGEHTRLVHIWGKALGPWPFRWISDLIVRSFIIRRIPEGARRLRELIQEDLDSGRMTLLPAVKVSRDEIAAALEQSLAQAD